MSSCCTAAAKSAPKWVVWCLRYPQFMGCGSVAVRCSVGDGVLTI